MFSHRASFPGICVPTSGLAVHIGDRVGLPGDRKYSYYAPFPFTFAGLHWNHTPPQIKIRVGLQFVTPKTLRWVDLKPGVRVPGSSHVQLIVFPEGRTAVVISSLQAAVQIYHDAEPN
jgi:hypothetical protein